MKRIRKGIGTEREESVKGKDEIIALEANGTEAAEIEIAAENDAIERERGIELVARGQLIENQENAVNHQVNILIFCDLSNI